MSEQKAKMYTILLAIVVYIILFASIFVVFPYRIKMYDLITPFLSVFYLDYKFSKFYDWLINKEDR